MLPAHRVHVEDVLELLHLSLHSYVKLGQPLTVSGGLFSSYVFALIARHYNAGKLQLTDFVPWGCVRGPGLHYCRVKESEQCIAEALGDVYGIKREVAEKNTHPDTNLLSIPALIKETEEEKAVKHELRWVLAAGEITKELERLKEEFRRVVLDKKAFPALNEYASLTEFDRRVRPVILALERTAMPSGRAIERVGEFLKTLYRKVDEKMAVKGEMSEKK